MEIRAAYRAERVKTHDGKNGILERGFRKADSARRTQA